jgi:hypothetical protein
MKLCIAGDFCIPDSYQGCCSDIVSERVVALFDTADVRIVNLECPVTLGRYERQFKTGPWLNGSTSSFEILKRLGVDVVTLANNHMMDYGAAGLFDTIAACRNNNVMHTGVGKNLRDAQVPLVLSVAGRNVAVVNFAENEWSSADRRRPGTNPYDIIECSRQIQEAARHNDHVIVIVHGGHEYYSLPSPRMVKEFRFFAESGASAIICHHAHTASGYEIFNGVPIFYGLGNFIFARPSSHPAWYSGVCVLLEFDDQANTKIHLVPVRQDRTTFALDLVEVDAANDMLTEIHTLNSVIADEKALQSAWDLFVAEKRRDYANAFNWLNNAYFRLLFRVLNRLNLAERFQDKRDMARHLNYIRCEAHRDVLLRVLKDRVE